jgi:hypothetical protein
MSTIPSNEKHDYAADVVARLSKDYQEILNSVSQIILKLRNLPRVIESDEMLADYAPLLTEARDLRKRLAVYHDAEKEPFLRGGQGCDQFFFGAMGRLAKRGKGEPNGVIDMADAAVDDWMQEKLRIERGKRRAEEEAARLKFEEAQRIEAAAQAAARDALDRAARARKQEMIDAHREEAAKHATVAVEATAATVALAERAEDARIDTLASASDLVRTRLEGGQLATMGTVPYVEILDVNKLDRDAIWPHIKEAHLLIALNSWAKIGAHKVKMDGAVIELRHRGQIR